MHCILDHLFVFVYLILLEEFGLWPYIHLSSVDLLSIPHWYCLTLCCTLLAIDKD